MPRRRVRYRPDGVIQLRRRVSELEVISLVSGLMFGVFLVQSILIATLLASPALLVITGALAAPGLWGAWIARSVRLAPAPVPTAPRPAAAPGCLTGRQRPSNFRRPPGDLAIFASHSAVGAHTRIGGRRAGPVVRERASPRAPRAAIGGDRR